MPSAVSNLLHRLKLQGAIVDALSRLLVLYPVDTALDLRCQLRAPWREERPLRQAGEAPYHLVVQGSVRLHVAGHDPIDMQAGDMVVLPHGSAHGLQAGAADEAVTGYRTIASGPVLLQQNGGTGELADILCGQFKFGVVARTILMEALPEIVFVPASSTPESSALRSLVALLRGETEVARPGSHAVVTYLAGALFSLLIRTWLEQASTMRLSGLLGLLAAPRLRPALQAMLEDPRRSWSLESLARTCHVSRATFARLFRATVGETPGEVLARTRMTQAAQWLAHGHQAMGDIAESAGYRSEAAFSRAFKRAFGVGPGQYRRDASPREAAQSGDTAAP
jgi:AraC family transcriptional regulator, activator of mtrCDE